MAIRAPDGANNDPFCRGMAKRKTSRGGLWSYCGEKTRRQCFSVTEGAHYGGFQIRVRFNMPYHFAISELLQVRDGIILLGGGRDGRTLP